MAQSDHATLPASMYYKFPWLNGGSALIFSGQQTSSSEEKPEPTLHESVQYLFSRYPEVKSRIIQFFQNAMENKEEITTSTVDETNLAMYPLLQIVITMLGNRILGNALSNIYAKHCQAELEKPKLYSDLNIRNICENLQIKVTLLSRNFIDGTEYPFQFHYTSYLAISTMVKDEYSKLINRPLQNGFVYLKRHDVVMLLREWVRKKTMPAYLALDKKDIVELESNINLQEIITFITELIKSNTKKFKSDSFMLDEKLDSDFFPPCIRSILYRSSKGENLGHYERLSLAFFFLNTNHTIEETVDLFRTCPDFDEKITRYQVDYAAGSGGKGKKYTMFRCDKLKTLQICRATDPDFTEEICAKGGKKRDGTVVPIRHPIHDFVFWKKVQLNRINRDQAAVIEEVIDAEPTQEEPSK